MLNPGENQDPNIDWKDLSFRRRSRVSEGSGNDRRFAIGLGVFIFVVKMGSGLFNKLRSNATRTPQI